MNIIHELRDLFRLDVLLKVSGVRRSVYYYHLQRLNGKDKYEEVKGAIQAIFKKHRGNYGYRRIHLTLRKQGFQINHKTVLRLMREMGLQAEVKVKKYRSYKGDVGKVAENTVNRTFEAEAPAQLWLTDVTEFKVNGTKLYLSAFLDVFNREIVGHAISRHPNFSLIQSSFEKAVKNSTSPLHTLVHSDQGWLYQIGQFQRLLAPYEMKQSMSRKGNCHDNALMEGFFGILKNECIYKETFESEQAAIQCINQYINYYNVERIKAKLNGCSPVEFRLQYEKIAI